MIESDRSEVDEESMDKLELSSDSIDTTIKKKRSRIEEERESIDKLELKRKKPKMEDCMAEAKDLFSKKLQSEQTKILKENNDEAISGKNSIDEYNIKKEKDTICSENGQNVHETSLCKSNMNAKEGKQLNKLVKQENKDKSSKEFVENTTASEMFTSENKKIGKAAIKKEDNAVIIKEEDKKNGIEKEHIIKSETTDTEVVDGLELSVECASEKEEPSSENEDEKDAKPRPKTIIVKAEPNESELECSLSEEEKHDSQEVADIPENKSEKKKTKRRGTRMSKVKDSESEDSQNNNSDEDYSPRSKRKLKKSPAMGKSTKRVAESKKGRGGNVKNSRRKSTEYESDENAKNADTASTERADKLVENEMEEELLEKESSVDKSDSNNSENEKSTKGKKTRRSNVVSDIVLA